MMVMTRLLVMPMLLVVMTTRPLLFVNGHLGGERASPVMPVTVTIDAVARPNNAGHADKRHEGVQCVELHCPLGIGQCKIYTRVLSLDCDEEKV
jgi:hypothetical protein